MVSLIIEYVMHNQTMNYVTKNKILHRHQSGFRKNRLTDTSHSYLTVYIPRIRIYDLFLYADSSCLDYQHKDVKETE